MSADDSRGRTFLFAVAASLLVPLLVPIPAMPTFGLGYADPGTDRRTDSALEERRVARPRGANLRERFGGGDRSR